MLSSDDDLAVKAVHVFSTGKAYQHKEHRYGSWMPKMLWALVSQSWIEIPINVYVIEHRDGLILFDTGLDPAIKSNPKYIAGAIERFFLRRLFRLEIHTEDTLSNHLKKLGYTAKDVTKVIVSHLHFDHTGGIKEVPQADLLVSSEAWQQLSGPHPERDFILREHIQLPSAKWQQIEFEPTDDPLLAPFGGSYDVMGDGTMVLLPTPGHTHGDMSLLLRSSGWPPLLFASDLTYETDLLMRDQIPGTGDREQLKSSYAKVRALKEKLPDLLILPAHDWHTHKALAALAERA